jgi:hypothetical protein
MEQHLSVLLLLLQHLKTGFPLLRITVNFTFFSAPGEWQTNATGLLLPKKSAIKAIEFCLSLNTMARDLLDKIQHHNQTHH